MMGKEVRGCYRRTRTFLGVVYKPKSTDDALEMTEYIERLGQSAAEPLATVIPDADEGQPL